MKSVLYGHFSSFMSRRHVFAISNAKTVEAGEEVLSRI